jgi:hypothetical protein
MARWQLVLTELNGAAVGELLNASSRRVSFGVNRVPSAGFTIRLDNPLADEVLEANKLVKAYRDGVLRFVGPIVAAEEVSGAGASGTVAVTAAGAAWRLAHRLIGKGATGYAQGTSGATVDRGTIIHAMLAAANADGYTGIDAGTHAASSSTYVAFAPYKNLLEAVNELANALDGPDWVVRPVEPTTVAAGVRIGLLDVAPVIGTARPAAAFEYGAGRRNVAEYRRTLSLDAMLNAAYGPPGSGEPGGTTVTKTDAPSIAAYGRLEGLVAADLPQPLRQALVDEHVRVRKAPRQLVTFTPTREDRATPGRVPQYGTDYVVGDVIPFRAVMRTAVADASIRVNASLRVYAVDFAIDDLGEEAPTLTLTAD